MALPTLLTFGAVPFAFPDDDRSIAARRHRASRLRQHMDQPHIRQQVNRHLLLTAGVVAQEAAEAADAVANGVVGGGPIYHAAPVAATPPQKRTSGFAAPPNSPSNSSSNLTFDFPAVPVNADSNLLLRRPSASTDSDKASELLRAGRGRRSQRKRRRVPSFKKNRVQPKMPHSSSEAGEADDEASDVEGAADDVDAAATDLKVAYITAATGNMDFGDETGRALSSSSDYSGEELQLRLKVWSEVQRTVEALLSEGAKASDWARAGRELRHIADNFYQDDQQPTPPQQQQQLVQQEQDVVPAQPMEEFVYHRDPPQAAALVADGVLDLPALFNMMLPFSLPRSLWIALINWGFYKAYKIFNQ